MSKKFPYGHDLNAYIDKAFELMKENFPWATRDMIAEHTNYGIEKVGCRYQYVSYYRWSEDSLKVYTLKTDCEGFLQRLADGHDWELEKTNPVKDRFKVDLPCGLEIAGWYMERYEFQSHVKGGYSVYVQGGNRSAGGSRTIFIPAPYFELPWSEFLDKYVKLVPRGSFGLGKEDLENVQGLKVFLGY